jgi:xanthine/uracil permease
MPLDPDRLAAAIYGLAGATLYGLFHLVTLALTGQAPTTADYFRAVLNVLAAIVAGALLSFFLTPMLVAVLPWVALRDPYAVGFIVGAMGWELIPVAIKVAKARLSKVGED